jgi:integrase
LSKQLLQEADVRGHIRRRGNKWAAVVYIGSGKYKWFSGFPTRKEAQRKLTEVLDQLDRGAYTEPTKKTCEEFLVEWLEAARPTLRENSWKSYRTVVNLHVLPYIGSLKLQKLSPSHLNSLYGDLLEKGDKRRKAGGGLSPRTVRYVHLVLTRALGDAVRWGYLPRNPASLANPPKAANKQMQVWSGGQLQQFLAAHKSHPHYMAWLLAATTGMRRSELLGLRWEDVDLDRGRLSVTQVLTCYGSKSNMRFTAPKTSSSRRQVALDPATVQALRQHRLQVFSRSGGLVFTEADGSPVYPQTFGLQFAAAVRKSGLPYIRFHDLRHTHATLALQAGVNPKVVQERLGHRSIAITLDTYSHVTEGLQEDAAQRIADVLAL